jgi:hypothetical protein
MRRILKRFALKRKRKAEDIMFDSQNHVYRKEMLNDLNSNKFKFLCSSADSTKRYDAYFYGKEIKFIGNTLSCMNG